jgi:hypothetical protein
VNKGIAGEQTWVPSMAEVKACCQKHHSPILSRQLRERIAREQQEKRERDPLGSTDPEEVRKRAVEHWERQKADMAGPTGAEITRAAQQRLVEMARTGEMKAPLTIGPDLRRYLDRMAHGASAAEIREGLPTGAKGGRPA